MIFLIEPVYKDYLWGGNKLKQNYNKKSENNIIAESWELSTHPDGICKVNGELLSELLKRHPEYLGKAKELPVLVKFIDSAKSLSIQVHPDDEYARKYENDNGKSEAWYILNHEEGAYIYFGFNDYYSKKEIEEAIKNSTILNLLNKVEVQDGDVYKIDAGTVHAIGEGITLIEFQQLSNCTYRLYDFDRVDKNGKKRELHIEKGLDVINVDSINSKHQIKSIINKDNIHKDLLVEIKDFVVYGYQVKGDYYLEEDPNSYISLSVIEGNMKIDDINLVKGQSIFITAGNAKHLIKGHTNFVCTKYNY